MSIVGKFFYRYTAKFSQSGEIVSEAAPGFVLIRFDIVNEDHSRTPDETTTVILEVSKMAMKQAQNGDWDYEWSFFDSRAALDAHLKEFLTMCDEIEEPAQNHTQGKMN